MTVGGFARTTGSCISPGAGLTYYTTRRGGCGSGCVFAALDALARSYCWPPGRG